MPSLARIRTVVSRVVFTANDGHTGALTHNASNRFAATRPLNSIKLAVREKASRISPVGRAVTAPTPDQGDPAGGGFDDEAGPACTLPGCPTWAACCCGVGHGLLRRWNCLRCGSCRPEAGNGPGRLRSSPGARLVDHPLEQTAHRDTAALRLGLDPGAPVVVEPDADDGGLGGRHDLVNSNPGCLQQRRRTVAGRWCSPAAASLPDRLRHPGRRIEAASTSPEFGPRKILNERVPSHG